MIEFQTVRWMNFLSTGNVFTEMPLNLGKSILITGENGSGKCLRGSTKVNVSFVDDEAEAAFKKFSNKTP